MKEICAACGHDRVFHRIGTGNGVAFGKEYCDDRHGEKCACDRFVARDTAGVEQPAHEKRRRGAANVIIFALEEHRSWFKSLRDTLTDEAIEDAREVARQLFHGKPLSFSEPVPMRLSCPECGTLHIDEGEFATKHHHTHACQRCGNVWRPAVVNTVGVRFLPGFKNGGV